ncbi:endoplasmic reticulum-Golgi intermediate compartment protein 3-like isoform X5 [Gossypium australe]|uniref:Endoplasmic reticulum-Golgi intermediate compartment protein 3-like isoform X5 n=1 Tax=Gossypium australe TaxID=47621 RepID=A0A5B6V5R3_9ROSI|nr:endoplasmic reticulum-Golgi intermediate compartment protein 3-like isoform X5 [Gossypium australe]
MSVDLKRGETLPIHINMTFPSLPCDVASVDAIDLSGKHEVDLDTNIWKLRLNSHGHIIGTEYLSDLVEKQHTTHNHGLLVKGGKFDFISYMYGWHGMLKRSCLAPSTKDATLKFKFMDIELSLLYDKEHHDGSAKKPHKFSFDKDAENMINKVKKALEDGEGCRVYGVLDVQRVAGNFHISVHALNIYVAQMIFGGATHVNVSHMIHDLSFGPKYPGLHNPLDDTVRILHDTSGTFKYYIKDTALHVLIPIFTLLLRHSVNVASHPNVLLRCLQIVPTEYRYISKEVLPTNQFSVSEYFSPMNEFDRTWPAVYFLYDLSPITVTIKEKRRSFLHFITRLSAVLGGTFALTGMLDRWMYRLIKALTTPSDRSAYR